MNITGTQIGAELHLGALQNPARWWPNSTLILRDVSVDAIQDLPNSWPDKLDLNGFTYRNLGGLQEEEKEPMINRPVEWFEGWLGKQAFYTSAPYQQLASVLRERGQPDKADEVLFAGRERGRGGACASGSRAQCTWLSFLSSVAGYGIGLHTFRVLEWVISLTALGTVFLWFSPNARRRGLPWLIGASLHRLLPIVELSKEFTNFFDNPSTNNNWPRNLCGWQQVYFALHAICGWGLGLILLAAMGGLLQKS